jgi:hypothetical protein
LAAFLELFLEEAPRLWALVMGKYEGLNGLAVRRQLINNRYIYIAIEGEGESSGNGGSRHEEVVRAMGVGLFPEKRSLANAKLMLFVNDRQAEPSIGNILLIEGVGADDDGEFVVFEPP